MPFGAAGAPYSRNSVYSGRKIPMTKRLGFAVIAQGTETTTREAELAPFDSDEERGYRYGKAMSALQTTKLG